VITASEVSVGLGYGYGVGGGTQPEATQAPSDGEEQSTSEGFGSGGGGGGSAMARPVAVIHVSANGVDVEPVFDLTKVALAFFTLIGSIFVMKTKMRRGAKKRQ
jgi:uncharacterized spore protein YtfJ